MFRTIFRILWVAIAFLVALGFAMVVLFVLGSVWVGDELRAAAPDDPVLHEQAPWLGAVLFIGTVIPALSAVPAILAVIAGEALSIRSWMYYVLAGGITLAAVPLLAGGEAGLPAPAAEYMTIFATAGFAGGLLYWVLAGHRA